MATSESSPTVFSVARLGWAWLGSVWHGSLGVYPAYQFIGG